MQKPDKTKAPSRSTAATVECCTELTCESGLRNHYFEGKRLTPDMFRVEQEYLNERRRLLNRAIHGWGVVYGYSIALHYGKSGRKEQAYTRLQMGNGLALDECGRELLHTGSDVAMNELIALDDERRRTDLDTLLPPPKPAASVPTPGSVPGGSRPNLGERPQNAAAVAQGALDPQIDWPTTDDEEKKTCWLLSAHYAEQRTGPVTVKDACSCDRDEWDHVCETVRFSLRRVSCDECCVGCTCELTCDCATGKCCCDREEPDDEGKADRKAHPVFQRGGCRCLCDHVTGLKFPECDGRLCKIEEPCARVWVDIRHGVPIACLKIEPDDCGGWTISEVDACGPRRLVKRNDLLFDLVRGCDLTNISHFEWKDWHRNLDPGVEFDKFDGRFGPVGLRQREYITNFSFSFSRPVRKATLDADCFSFTVLSFEREGKWLAVQRVPITRIQVDPDQDGDPKDHVRGGRLVVGGAWVEDGLRGSGSVFLDDETWVEIEVRGDFILDCNGQPIDANAVGRFKHRTGNGTPGGTFLSTFKVLKRPPLTYDTPPPPDKKDPAKGAAS